MEDIHLLLLLLLLAMRWLLCCTCSAFSYLFLRPSGRFLLPTSVAGFMQAKSLKSGWRTSGSVGQTADEAAAALCCGTQRFCMT